MTAVARVHDRRVDAVSLEAGERFTSPLDLGADGPWQVDVSMCVHGNREGRRTDAAMLLSGAGDTLSLTLRWFNTHFGDFDDRRILRVSACMNDSCLLTKDLEQASGMSGTAMTVWLNCTGDGLDIYAGPFYRDYAGRLPGFSFRPDSVTVGCDRPLTLNYLYVMADNSEYAGLQRAVPAEEVIGHCRRSTDPIEGVWRYLDRENDPRTATPGGAYILATVRNDSIPSADIFGNPRLVSGYDIIYLSGAVTHSGMWRPGMLKGRMLPTGLTGCYDLQWYDAACDPVHDPDNDNNADFSDTPAPVLTFNFPLLQARLRFTRVPASDY